MLGGFNTRHSLERIAKFEVTMAKDKPAHEARIGAVKAAVWRNDTANGVRYNVTFSRLYKDGTDWKSADSFGRDDLLVLAKVADQAHSWIHSQSHEEENGPPEKRCDAK